MIDFYWLKSFTEIMQLFLSVLFLIYLRVKFDQSSPIIFWLSLFFYIKLGTDLFGILNYTSWISNILTRPVLGAYRVAMGPLELGMITSFILFIRTSTGHEFEPNRKSLLYFIPAMLLLLVNSLLIVLFQSTLLEVFDVVKLIWIGSLSYTLFMVRKKVFKLLIVSMLLWNILWLTEVVLHEQLGLITESTSWIMFVSAELILTIGLSYLLVKIIAQPRLLKFERIQDVLPESLQKNINRLLSKAIYQDKIHKDPELKASILAEQLSVSQTDLTLYLNRVLKKNFNQYITELRIEESIHLLKGSQYSTWSIEQIMLESGFSSKSVFNTAFKGKTQLTPSQFRKKHKETGL